MSEVTFNFSGKNFVVIGASSGMGRQIALDLAAAGAHVLAIARNRTRLQQVQDKYSDLITIEQVDVCEANKDKWASILKGFTSVYGKIHGAVYTAGTAAITPLQLIDEDVSRNIMETGFWGGIKALQVLTSKRYAVLGASYVLFSSVSGYIGGERGLAIYSAAKAAIRMAVKSFAHDLSRNKQRINTVCPGQMKAFMRDTTIVDDGLAKNVVSRHLLGLGNSTDISGMVLFLLSDRSRWITGQDFIIDGGYLCGAFR